MPTVAAQGRLRALEQAWLHKTFGKYGAVALSLPCDTAGHWIPSHGILVFLFVFFCLRTLLAMEPVPWHCGVVQF
jgi:hypothetical protein